MSTLSQGESMERCIAVESPIGDTEETLLYVYTYPRIIGTLVIPAQDTGTLGYEDRALRELGYESTDTWKYGNELRDWRWCTCKPLS